MILFLFPVLSAALNYAYDLFFATKLINDFHVDGWLYIDDYDLLTR